MNLNLTLMIPDMLVTINQIINSYYWCDCKLDQSGRPELWCTSCTCTCKTDRIGRTTIWCDECCNVITPDWSVDFTDAAWWCDRCIRGDMNRFCATEIIWNMTRLDVNGNWTPHRVNTSLREIEDGNWTPHRVTISFPPLNQNTPPPPQ